MNNKFLYELQKDILDRTGYYILYVFVAIPIFVITITNIEIYFHIFRVILSSTALLFLVLIYLKSKNSRNEKETKIIIKNILFSKYYSKIKSITQLLLNVALLVTLWIVLTISSNIVISPLLAFSIISIEYFIPDSAKGS